MTGPFSRKISRVSCDLTALWKIEKHCANAVKMWLGVTRALSISFREVKVCLQNKCHIHLKKPYFRFQFKVEVGCIEE